MRKVGQGHLAATVRQGAKEVAQALPAFPESIRPVEEPGLVGNVTPQEVMEDKGKGYQQKLEEYAKQAEQQRENAPELER